MEELEDPTRQQQIDTAALERHLREHIEGFAGPIEARQFRGGQSNPTFLLRTPAQTYVLRKKPAGTLLATAHMVEREYRVMTALAPTDVPVPRTYVLCEDTSVIGTPFFVMAYLQGRLFWDAALPELSPAERTACYDEKIRVLAALHNVDVAAVGLSDYGKPGNYMARQIKRWSRQYVDAKTEEVASMDRLMQWLPAHVPDDDTSCLVHGDFRFDNMMFHPSEARVIGVLDWELSTLGHPLADLAYTCLPYHNPRGADAASEARTLADVAGGDSGIPTEAEQVQRYCELTGRSGIDHWTFYLAFSMFRLASIVQGVYKRALQGNASSPEAIERRDACRQFADTAWALVERAAD